MSQEGRGGSPRGFIGKHLASDFLGKSRIGSSSSSGSFRGANRTSASSPSLPEDPLPPLRRPNSNPNSSTGGLSTDGYIIDGDEGDQAYESDEYRSAVGNHPITPADQALLVVKDLKKSGLEVEDLRASVMDSPEKAACNLPASSYGFVIPYNDISGEPIPYYRVRILNAEYATNGVKYKQPRKTQNHIYFPRNFRQVLTKWCKDHPHEKILLITEGEKKAACATKFGFPCVGLGGVESWRSRTIVLPGDTEIYSTRAEPLSEGPSTSIRGSTRGRPRKNANGMAVNIKARLPSSDTSVPELTTLAKGFGDMLDLITQFNLTPIIIYDSDRLGTLKAEVQRAATMLAYELVYLGIPPARVKQVVLPALSDDPAEQEYKSGLDDFMMVKGPEDLFQLIFKALNDPKAFPRHPNPKGFISVQLQNSFSRKAMQQVASMILTELDASGARLRDMQTGSPYYYDRDSHILMKATLGEGTRSAVPYHETPFGTLLYQKYGISSNDKKVLVWLASQFTGEDPVTDVIPRRVLTLITEKEDQLNPHGIALQISDSQYIAVSPSSKLPIELCQNGQKGILFEQDKVDPIDPDLLLESFEEQLSEVNELGYMQNWWFSVLNESNIGMVVDNEASDQPDENGEITPYLKYTLTPEGRAMRQYASLLFYISPFLLRWRGLQLPVELTVGSPGSGKSSLYSLRQQVITGRPKLRNIPTDIRDWHASLANSGGLHVVDNVHFLDRELKQRISDELCRIVTEPDPHIEMRKYFTNTDVISIAVGCTFAFTSIQMPFHNEDLIQRAVTLRTESIVGKEPEGDWVDDKLKEKGGREAWVAHHLLFLHLFLKQQWHDNFRTQHRLAHLEQALTNASKVLDPSTFETTFRPTDRLILPIPQVAGAIVRDQEKASPIPASPSPPQAREQGGEGAASPFGEASAAPNAVTKSLGSVLRNNQSRQMVSTDWVLAGIKEFLIMRTREEPRKKRITFFMGEVSEWAIVQEDYQDNEVLVNSRKLGRYASQRMAYLAQTLGVFTEGTYANKIRYVYHTNFALDPEQKATSQSDPG